jgi:hypothetical protein
LYLVLLQSLFYDLSNCILLFCSYISSAAVILLASVALMVQFSLPFSRAGGASLLYSLFFFSFMFSVV